MAKRNDWSESLKDIQNEKANKKLNIVLRSQEKEEQKAKDWAVGLPKDVRPVLEENYHPQVAPTSATTRDPRAKAIAYNSQTKTLVVVFWDNTWWQYNNVSTQMWLALKSSSSTGGYLHSSGLNQWGDMGDAVMDDIPPSVRAQIASTAMIASNLRKK